ncbi:restriction endonuclease subunit S [Ralstonia pseudosolanacearum]|uniref:restriction endonuclease subunit S n=1 Tax=Ralstonia pseudosolanacearum TaxID=1310165 RepID=UPI0009BF6DB3|nr:restriction endonuclease subunit S [Ralstonia pseudosolanacearum]MCL1620342.1 restriction endonuclease subunit S [Ralstonia pseudosolanacearum CaRs-Mep]
MEVKEPSAKYLAKPAYKQSEAGPIPQDWQVKQVGDLQPFVTSGSRGWASFYSEFGSPFIRITNLSRERIRLDLRDLRFVSISRNASEGVRTQLNDGDVLISITADIGIVGFVTEKIPKPAYINQHIALVRFDPSQTNPRYVSYFLSSKRSQKLFRSLADSGAKAGMNLTTVRQIKVALPPTVNEQQAIAEALSDADALIEALEQLLAKKRQIKQGAMQELLTGRKRLPGFAEKWKTRALCDLFNFNGGFTASRDQLSIDGHCYLHYGDIHTSNKSYIDVISEFFEIPKLNIPLNKVRTSSLLKDGDVVFVDASEDDEGTSKHVVVINQGDIPLISGLHTITAKSKTDELANIYKMYCFQTPAVKAQFRFFAVGTKVSGVSKSNIGKITISVPSVEEQTAIATILSDMDAEIATLEAKITKARSVKRGMMQQLLTGKIRLI